MPVRSDFTPTLPSGDWYIAFEYLDTGHVNDLIEWQINDEVVFASLQPRITELNQSRESRGQPAMSKVTWQLKPTYHIDSRSLEWAVRGDGVSLADTVLDYNNRFLTRRGILQVRATIFHGGTVGLAWIQDVVSALSIKRGETYADFQTGEKTASGGLASFAKASLSAPHNPTPSPRAASESVGGMKAFWIVLGVLGCVGIVGGGILAKKLRQQRLSQHAELPTESESAAASQQDGLRINGSRNFKFERRPKPARNGANGNGNGASHNGNGNSPKRKRMFNYHKFYTEMVLQGPSPMIAEAYNGYDVDPVRHNGAYANGNGNGHQSNGNGNGNGHSDSATPDSNGSSSSAAVAKAHSELISTQRALIEEQKRLIHEQARLIEEKSKLIAEKNRLLEKQSSLIDNNLL